MKVVLTGGMNKKVGFKPLADDDMVRDNSRSLRRSGSEEKKSEHPNPLPLLSTHFATSPANAFSNQASTPCTVSPASSAESSSPSFPQQTSNSDLNNNKHTKGRKMFRLPRYFWNRRRGGSSGNSTSSHGENSEDEELAKAGESDDPVMAVFQSRYKNRVRWDLDDLQDSEKKEDSGDNTTRTRDNNNNNKDSNESGALDSGLGPSSSFGGAKQNGNSSSIKKFVKGALFGGGGGNQKEAAADNEFQKEVEREVAAENGLVWESNDASTVGGEVLYTAQRKQSALHNQKEQAQLTFSFTEDLQTRATVQKLIKKARRAQSVYYRYDYAVNYLVRAMDTLTTAKYPDLHPTVRKTLESLNEAHHKLSSFNNSANIVKIGIKYEDSGELVRALKMYSIAYRIRRDNLSRTHPSLVVLLNMLGSIQTKRGEYEEAMQIYELALRDPPKDLDNAGTAPALTPSEAAIPSIAQTTGIQAGEDESVLPTPPPPLSYEQFSTRGNLLAKSVTYREMGTIFEKWERREEALKMYHLSLDCVAEWKIAAGVSAADKGLRLGLHETINDSGTGSDDDAGNKKSSLVADNVTVKKSYARDSDDDDQVEKGEMELMVSRSLSDVEGADVAALMGTVCYYDSFFPPHLEKINAKKGRSTAAAAAMASGDSEGLDRRDDYADIDVALTIHQIAQLFRKQGQFYKALEAYAVALRGMKYSLGNYHPNVAAILGNFGNLQKEMGDLDAAYDTYQEVLGIESYRLGLSHPDVAITLHNIATIDAARGNYERSLRLYEQVMCLQQKLFGREHISIAVTSACMGDVYEALGQMKDAFEAYEDALRIKSAFQGHHTLEVARILHKLAKVALHRGDHRLASSYISRAIFVYRLNKIPDGHEWVVDAHRDSADVDASLALTKKMTFEC
ncbi:Kinesin light chain [Seminavis robusta]|uniref:Kinesin light chain n=1 Tax=Seminavis robusta TaxID=568900 RepID=A0A9N8EFE8_9STRA|nr:Kinesin light chain [Seminavis robusta]|eukprot:Sro912_g219330.1 Kinesin light chain (906) ;mRNA; r:28239-30956